MAAHNNTREIDQTKDCPDWHDDRGLHETFITSEGGQTVIRHTCEKLAMEALEARHGF